LVVFWLIVLGMVSNGASSDQTFGSHVMTDLGITVRLDSVYDRINSTSTYKIIARDGGKVSWSFSKTGRSDSGLIYSTGRLEVGSQDGFGPAVGDRLEGELRTEMDLLNSTQSIPDDLKRKALENAVYYSGDDLVDARTWDSCGNALVKSGHYNRSLIYYNRSIKAGPSIPNPWNNRGVAFRNLGKYKQAVASYDQALNLTPNSSVTWNDKAESLYHLGEPLLALECFNRSIQLEPNAPAWYNKGIILLELGKFGEALESYNQSISLDPYNAEAWNNKGVSLARTGRNDSALGCFNYAATLNPKFAGAWANGGMVLHALGQEDKSQIAFSAARALKYNRTTVYFRASTLPPALIDGQAKKSEGFGAAASILVLFMIGLYYRKEVVRCTSKS
jgi:tetratricopeptide (TPR) repeat protein